MKEVEFLTLTRGDIVENRWSRGETYIVTGNFVARFEAVRHLFGHV